MDENEELEDSGKKPGKFKKILKILIMLIVLIILVIAGFFIGIYFKLIDSNDINEKYELYNMPIIGEYFVKPAGQESSSVDEAVSKTEPKAEDKKKSKNSKPVVLSKEEIEKQTKERQAAERKRVSKLARLYNEMKPEDAAKILEGMDDDIVISILQRMDESQVSQVLTKFDTDRAANITKVMYNGLPKRVMQNPAINDQNQNKEP
ncbi:MAG: magnesium transporter MgtE [Anaerovibrio sp.]|uniref:MotE family protein n=1 Tax=Anaerovibrio sp. TaxID=1872532 RepID=UPI0025E5F9FF|nr:magnesium transporter MgtE [Anaerovibrio sp.]MCR5175906.1 magnesium transporter MgtE [Anaerovibrio sp.]